MAYEAQLIKSAKGLPKGVYIANVYHDDDCPKLKNGECTCNPEVETKEVVELVKE